LPIPRWAPLAGRILADVVKQTLGIALLLALGYLLGFRLATSIVHLLGMILLVLAFAVAFSWVMVLVGVMARDPEHVQLFGVGLREAVVEITRPEAAAGARTDAAPAHGHHRHERSIR